MRPTCPSLGCAAAAAATVALISHCPGALGYVVPLPGSGLPSTGRAAFARSPSTSPSPSVYSSNWSLPRAHGAHRRPRGAMSFLTATPQADTGKYQATMLDETRSATVIGSMVTTGEGVVVEEAEEDPSDGNLLTNAIPDEITDAWWNIDPGQRTFILNSAAVLLFVGFCVTKISTVDLELSRGWTWWEIVLRMPSSNFLRYETTVGTNPIVTKAFTSAFAYGLGDFCAQTLQGKDLKTIDLWRTGRSSLAGLIVHGPMCHYWIEFMQTYLNFGGAWWNFIPKVVADQTVYSIVLNAAYTSFTYGLQGYKPKEVWELIQETAWPAITSSWRFWPLIHCVSFNNVIPKDLKLLFIDFMEVVWVTILSSVANQDNKEEEDGELSPLAATAE